MGSDTITTRSNGQVIDETWFNILKSVLAQDILPRDTNGVVSNKAGSLGSDTYKFKRANVDVGHWSAGDIKIHHSYNGLVPVGAGWFPCTGSVINEANYNTVHGSGKWATDIVTSPLDGLYSPNMVNRFPVGASATTQNGSAAMSAVGNASNQIDLQHTHTIAAHNHAWYYDSGNGAEDKSYNSSGNLINIAPADTGVTISGAYAISISGSGAAAGSVLGGNTDPFIYYTGNTSITPANALSTTQDIKPDSIEVTYYIRII